MDLSINAGNVITIAVALVAYAVQWGRHTAAIQRLAERVDEVLVTSAQDGNRIRELERVFGRMEERWSSAIALLQEIREEQRRHRP